MRELKFLTGAEEVTSIDFPQGDGRETCFNLKLAKAFLEESFGAVREALRNISDVVVLIALRIIQ